MNLFVGLRDGCRMFFADSADLKCRLVALHSENLLQPGSTRRWVKGPSE